MALGPEIPKPDIARARKVMEPEKIPAPPSQKPNTWGSYVVFFLALAIAGAIVYYVLNHKQQFGQLWVRATHPDSVPAQVAPGQ